MTPVRKTSLDQLNLFADEKVWISPL